MDALLKSYKAKYKRDTVSDPLPLPSPDPTSLIRVNDVSVTLSDKTDGSDPKKQEGYWMKILKRIAPYGLDIEDSA